MSQVLGQVLNEKGNPTNENLRRYDYTDNKSKNQWAFSFLIDEEHDGISIRQVTETELRQIVREETVKLLSNLIK